MSKSKGKPRKEAAERVPNQVNRLKKEKTALSSQLRSARADTARKATVILGSIFVPLAYQEVLEASNRLRLAGGILFLLVPIASTMWWSFDWHRRRHRQARPYRWVAILIASLVVLTLTTVFATHQSGMIASKHEKEVANAIVAEMQQSGSNPWDGTIRITNRSSEKLSSTTIACFPVLYVHSNGVPFFTSGVALQGWLPTNSIPPNHSESSDCPGDIRLQRNVQCLDLVVALKYHIGDTPESHSSNFRYVMFHAEDSTSFRWLEVAFEHSPRSYCNDFVAAKHKDILPNIPPIADARTTIQITHSDAG